MVGKEERLIRRVLVQGMLDPCSGDPRQRGSDSGPEIGLCFEKQRCKKTDRRVRSEPREGSLSCSGSLSDPWLSGAV